MVSQHSYFSVKSNDLTFLICKLLSLSLGKIEIETSAFAAFVDTSIDLE